MDQEQRVGRPEIGPEVKARVPYEVAEFIRARRAAKRGATQAAVVRSLIIAGYEAQRGNR